MDSDSDRASGEDESNNVDRSFATRPVTSNSSDNQLNLQSDLDHVEQSVQLRESESKSWPFTATATTTIAELHLDLNVQQVQPTETGNETDLVSERASIDEMEHRLGRIDPRCRDGSRSKRDRSLKKRSVSNRSWKEPARCRTPKERMKWAKSPSKEQVSSRYNRSKVSPSKSRVNQDPPTGIGSIETSGDSSHSEKIKSTPEEMESLLLKAVKDYSTPTSSSAVQTKPVASRTDYFGNPVNLSPGVNALALDTSLDTSGARMASPASSIASKRGLEWDSGADVGYLIRPTSPVTPLSTVDRFALERGSAALQLASNKLQTQTVSDQVLDSSKQFSVSDPLAQSTPLELTRKPGKAARDKISPMSTAEVDPPLPTLPHRRNLLPNNVGEALLQALSELGSDKEQAASDLSPSPVTVLHKSTNKSVQTVNLISQHSVAVQVESSSNRSSSEKKSQATKQKVLVEDIRRHIERIQLNASVHQRVIDNIKHSNTYPRTHHDQCSLRESKNYQEKHTQYDKVFASRKPMARCSTCHSDCKGAHRKVRNYTESTNEHSASSCASPQLDDEGSNSSYGLNETPRSANATNEQGTIGESTSFEYLAGDVFERNNHLPATRGHEVLANGHSSRSEVPKSLKQDMTREFEKYMNLVQGGGDVDPSKKQDLLLKFMNKLITTEYSEDNESSVTGTSVVYVANTTTGSADGVKKTSREKSTQVHLVSETSNPGSSNVGSAKPASESSSLDHHCKFYSPQSASGASSMPPNSSSSRSYCGNVDQDWRQPVTQSEKRLMQRQIIPDEQTSRELARINEKIERLNNLKLLLEHNNMLRGNPKQRNIKHKSSIAGNKKSDHETSVKESSTSESLKDVSDNVWSSHVRIPGRNSSEAFTQMPSTLSLQRPANPVPRSVASTNPVPRSINSTDSSLDHRAKQGRINVFVQTMNQRGVDPLCCCQCERKLLQLKDKQKTIPVANVCSCKCHPARPMYTMTANAPNVSEATPRTNIPTSMCHNCYRPNASVDSSRQWRQTPQIANENAVNSGAHRIGSTSTLDKRATRIPDESPIVCPRWFTDSQALDKCNCCRAKACAVEERETRSREDPTLNGDAWNVSPILQPAVVTPRPVGYVLTLETPSDTSGASDTLSKHSLQEMRVKMPSRRPTHSHRFPSDAQRLRQAVGGSGRPQVVDTAVHSSKMPGVEIQGSSVARDSRGRLVLELDVKIPADKTKNKSESQPRERLTLQECLRRRRPEYIRTAEYRRKCLAEMAVLRELRHDARQRLIALASHPDTEVSAEALETARSIPPMALAVKRVFSQRSMLRQTKKVQQKCSEVLDKKVEMKRKEDYRTNRLMAEIFKRNLKKNVLKGAVNLSNSVSVISSLGV